MFLKYSKLLKFLANTAGVLLLLESSALAQTSYSVVLDAPPRDFRGIKKGDSITVATNVPSGVCCSVHAEKTIDKLFFSNVKETSESITGELRSRQLANVVSRGRDIPATVKMIGFEHPDRRSHICVPEGSIRPLNVELEIDATSDDADREYNARVECVANYLAGTFNLNGSEYNFLEIQFLGFHPLQPVTVKWHTIVVAGGLASPTGPFLFPGSGHQGSVTFGGGNGSVQTAPLHEGFVPGSWGTVEVTHDGVPGTVRAVVKRYKINPFIPNDITLVGVEPLMARSR